MGRVGEGCSSRFLSSVLWSCGHNSAGVPPCHHGGSRRPASRLLSQVQEKRNIRVEWEVLLLKLSLSFTPCGTLSKSLNLAELSSSKLKMGSWYLPLCVSVIINEVRNGPWRGKHTVMCSWTSCSPCFSTMTSRPRPSEKPCNCPDAPWMENE